MNIIRIDDPSDPRVGPYLNVRERDLVGREGRFVAEGKVVLNIADRAVVGLQMDNEWIGFTARFGGVSQPVSVPVGAVLAVYARETGQGMVLPEEGAGPHAHADIDGHDGDGPETPPEGPSDPAPGKRPHLRVVK